MRFEEKKRRINWHYLRNALFSLFAVTCAVILIGFLAKMGYEVFSEDPVVSDEVAEAIEFKELPHENRLTDNLVDPPKVAPVDDVSGLELDPVVTQPDPIKPEKDIEDQEVMLLQAMDQLIKLKTEKSEKIKTLEAEKKALEEKLLIAEKKPLFSPIPPKTTDTLCTTGEVSAKTPQMSLKSDNPDLVKQIAALSAKIDKLTLPKPAHKHPHKPQKKEVSKKKVQRKDS